MSGSRWNYPFELSIYLNLILFVLQYEIHFGISFFSIRNLWSSSSSSPHLPVVVLCSFCTNLISSLDDSKSLRMLALRQGHCYFIVFLVAENLRVRTLSLSPCVEGIYLCSHIHCLRHSLSLSLAPCFSLMQNNRMTTKPLYYPF